MISLFPRKNEKLNSESTVLILLHHAVAIL